MNKDYDKAIKELKVKKLNMFLNDFVPKRAKLACIESKCAWLLGIKECCYLCPAYLKRECGSDSACSSKCNKFKDLFPNGVEKEFIIN